MWDFSVARTRGGRGMKIPTPLYMFSTVRR